uniref:LRAT domain-containing protein n=1 Tax=Nothobranchius furzeri TaxID=105023 RepID=A0A8C6NR76_NOTFU
DKRILFSHTRFSQIPGDLIEVKCGVYKHWIVYIGEDNVVHFGGIGESSLQKEKLKDVVKDGKWKINNFLDQKYQPRKDDDIVKEACARVGSSLTYDVLGYNCEHFATELRYGKPECRQVAQQKIYLRRRNNILYSTSQDKNHKALHKNKNVKNINKRLKKIITKYRKNEKK